MFDLHTFISTSGYLGVPAVIFAESGLFFGFFLPGDSLLFVTGFLAARGYLNVWLISGLCFFAAVLGDSVGYAFGKKFGRKLFSREDSWFFHKSHIVKAEQFYEKHGKQTIILSRFVPIVRTFAPIVAGIGGMNYKTFITYNVIGGFIWSFGFIFLGYFFGYIKEFFLHQFNIQLNDDAGKYVEIATVILVIIISLLPMILHVFKEDENRVKLKSTLKRLIKKYKKNNHKEEA